MAMQYTGHVMMETRDNNIALPLVGVLVTCSRRKKILSIIFIKNEKLLNSNNNSSTPEFSGSSGISLFSDWLRIC